MKTKSKFLFLLLVLCSCTESVLNKNEFIVTDTLDVSKNGLGYVLGYDVIVKYDNEYHFGYVDKDGNLTRMSFREIKICQE